MSGSAAVVLSSNDPTLRRRLRGLLDSQPSVRVAAECGTGAQTVDAVLEHAPTVVVLDVQLPDLDGLGIVERIGVEAMPTLVFLTRLEPVMLSVLELHGINYLVEPFNDEEFLSAFRRAVRQTEPRALAGVRRRLGRMLAGDESGSRERRIPVRNASNSQFVHLDDIRWVEGAGAFSRLHLDDRTHVVKATLDELTARFADDFLRIHSTLVRSSEIAEIQRTDGGEALVTLRDGNHLRVTSEPGFDVIQAGLDDVVDVWTEEEAAEIEQSVAELRRIDQEMWE